MKKGKILKSNKDKIKINISFWSLGDRQKRIGRKEERREGRREEDQRYGTCMEFVKFCMEKYRFLYTSMDAMVLYGKIKP